MLYPRQPIVLMIDVTVGQGPRGVTANFNQGELFCPGSAFAGSALVPIWDSIFPVNSLLRKVVWPKYSS